MRSSPSRIGSFPDYELVVATQDWHPPDHGSFAVNHPGRNVYEQIDLNGLPQTLWPVHCVQNTRGAELAPGLNRTRIARIFPVDADGLQTAQAPTKKRNIQ